MSADEDVIVVPHIDAAPCGYHDAGYHCTRRPNHGGRHAAGYPTNGPRSPWRIVAVWGEDVHADTRRRGRDALIERGNARLLEVVNLIENGVDPDHAWQLVEIAAAAADDDGPVVIADEISPIERRRALDALSEGIEPC